ncbi:MAG: condensation domain-containing protein, partial [Blastocatellia bacterium]
MPIGRAITNNQVYVLNPEYQHLAIGAAGEIYIAGDGVALGYLNRAGTTSERFVPDPFSNEPGARFYKTGDRGRWLAEGNLEFLGRLDHQIKIRGYRIEPGEIEFALISIPAVREAVVIAKEQIGNATQIAAYVTLNSDADAGEMKKRLRNRLPDYMVPHSVVIVERIPLTASGKIDKRALASLGVEQQVDEGNYVEPVSHQEKALAEIWERVLGVGRIGATQNFFELGGDSIISLRIVAAAREAGIELTPAEVLRYPTVREQISIAGSRVQLPGSDLVTEHQALSPTLLGEIADGFPLTSTQRGMLFHTIYEHQGGVYVTQLVLGLRGQVNVNALSRAWQAATDRHKALRMSLHWQGVDQPYQIVERNVRIRIDELDWRQLRSHRQSEELETFLADDRRRGFHLDAAPLMRFTLIRMADDGSELVW